jgi:phosphate transport system protein
MTIRSRHILQNFEAALESLRANVFMMASLTDRNLQNSMSCLLDRESQSCSLTIADEEEIDALEKTVDCDGIAILLRYQPVAFDLRQIISAMKLSGNLERISDQAVKIAERSQSLNKKPPLPEVSALGPIFLEAITLFRDSIRAYADADVALAHSIQTRDKEIDEMNRQITKDLTVRMGKRPGRIADYVHLLFIARYLERIGDHAKNIGEDAVYAAEAKDIRHSKNVLVS